MNILFKQPEKDSLYSADLLENFGILQCYLKRITSKHDKSNITTKRHYHKCVEVHIIEEGYQIYEIDGKSIKLEKGSLLMLPPLSYHRMSREAEGTEKYSFTFEVKNNSTADQLCAAMKSYFLCATSNSVRECIAYIEKEKRESKPYHNVLICSRVFECILHLLRLLPSTAAEAAPEHLGDMRLAIAKQYIADNVCYAVSVGELAAYCHIGKKQLTRIFLCEEGCTVAEYVRMVRCRYIEKLLKDPSETLLGISEQMHFSSEYYFNSFFKRCSGMTPGAYRRSVLGTQ